MTLLLNEQKVILLEIIKQYDNWTGPTPPPDKKYGDALKGILHFIDAFQELAADQVMDLRKVPGEPTDMYSVIVEIMTHYTEERRIVVMAPSEDIAEQAALSTVTEVMKDKHPKARWTADVLLVNKLQSDEDNPQTPE